MAPKNQKTKRQAILEAAIKVFAKKGFNHARISEIARAAKVADGTIYLYFKNKDDLLISIFEESLERIITNIKSELARQTDPREKLKTFIRFHLQLVSEHRNLAGILQVELRQSNKFMKEYVPRKFLEYLEIIAEIIREGQAAGLFHRHVSPGIYKRALFGALDEIALHAVLTNKGQDYLETCMEQLGSIFLEGLASEDECASARRDSPGQCSG